MPIGPLPTRPNQRAELDFARLDLLVVDPADRLPIERPTLAALRDKYTGFPLGVFICFDPPSYRVAMECMLYTSLPKTHVKAFFHTQHEYLACQRRWSSILPLNCIKIENWLACN